MTPKQQAKIDEFLATLPQGEQAICRPIVDCLTALDYIPQTNRAFLSFKHRENGKVIAKIRKGEIRIKFFACKNPPQKYVDELRREAEQSDWQYSMPVPPPDKAPLPPGAVMKPCTLACNVCTGGKMRYYYRFPDGKEIFRCGAYPVRIPNVEESDLAELLRILQEQHEYFLSLT